MLVDPFGNVLSEAVGEPALVAGEVDPAAVREAREHFSFLADRRPEIYERLAASGVRPRGVRPRTGPDPKDGGPKRGPNEEPLTP